MNFILHPCLVNSLLLIWIYTCMVECAFDSSLLQLEAQLLCVFPGEAVDDACLICVFILDKGGDI